MRTEVKTPLGGFVRQVINQRSIYIFNFRHGMTVTKTIVSWSQIQFQHHWTWNLRIAKSLITWKHKTFWHRSPITCRMQPYYHQKWDSDSDDDSVDDCWLFGKDSTSTSRPGKLKLLTLTVKCNSFCHVRVRDKDVRKH